MILEGRRVLTRFLDAARLSQVALVGRQALPEDAPGAHAVALGPAIMVFVLVVPSDYENGQEQFVAAMLADVASECDGRFLSGSARERVGTTPVNTGFAQCRGEEINHFRYALTRRRAEGFYLIGLVSGGDAGSRPEQGDVAAGVSDLVLREAALQAAR